MIDPIDPEASIGYLTLGVFAQSIAERLADPERQTAEDLECSLDEAINALQAVKNLSFEEVETSSGLRPFQDYDQVTTLYEVLEQEDGDISLDAVIDFLEKMGGQPEQVDREFLNRVIHFFDDLSLEALQLSRRPPEGIPSGVRDLCRQG